MVKFAKRVTGRHQIIAFHGGYHGVWNASNALTTGTSYRKGYGPFMGGVIHAPYPYAYRFPFDTTHKSAEQIAGEYVDYLLNTPYTAADDVAAAIVEPVQGEGGYVPMAGLVMRSDLAAKIPDGSAPNTFAANSLSAAVSLTTISLLQDPELDLLNRAHQLGQEAQEALDVFGDALKAL